MSITQTIKDIIEKDFSPIHYELINESHKHAGHAGDDGSGETNYKLMVVSNSFEGLSRVERQRLVNTALGGVYRSGLHALSFKLLTEKESEIM